MAHYLDRSHGGDIAKYLDRPHFPKNRLLDFSANINPLGLPQRIKDRLIKNLDGIMRYPQPDSDTLKAALAAFHRIRASNLLIGNGSTELIYLLPRALGPKKVLILVPSFSEYEFAAKAAGARIEFLKSREEEAFKPDVPGLIKMIPAADLVFLCNPNNPTGCCLPHSKILYIMQSCIRHKTMLVIDEAFMDFMPDDLRFSMISGAVGNKFVLVIRSLTKFFAIPGLRLGYLAGHQDLIEKISYFLYPWNVNFLAQIAGEEIIKEKDYIKKSREYVFKEKSYLFRNLKKFSGLKICPPNCNFILCKLQNSRVKNADELDAKLARKGIIIRNCGNFRGLSDKFFRVAVRKRPENNRLLTAMKKIL